MEMSAERLFKDNAIIRLTFKAWNNKKEIATDSDRRTGEWYRFVDPKKLQPINAKIRQVRDYLSGRVGMHFDWGPGLYLVRRDKLLQILEQLRDFEFEFTDLVETFVYDEYEAALDETRDQGKLTDEQLDTAPVADQLVTKFKMSYTTFVVGMPETTGHDELDMTLRDEFCATLSESFEDIGEKLRQELLELLQVVHTAVTDKERKKLYESMLTNVDEWCTNFETRNFLADENLDALAKRAKEMVDAVTIDDLRSSTEHKAALAAQSGDLLREVQALKPARRKIIL